MSIQRTRGDSNKGGLFSLFNNVTGSHSYMDIPSDGINKVIDIGGGFGVDETVPVGTNHSNALGAVNYYANPTGFGFLYGDWTIIPNRTFSAQVKLWGAGGGSHTHGGNSFAGGGGHARGDILFMEGIPYTFWVGQGGFYTQSRYGTNEQRHQYRTGGTFGGGGGGGHNAGSGGGLSGIFFNTLGHESQGVPSNVGHNGAPNVGGTTSWFRTPSPQNALLIAGGGGGAGHGNQSHHGQGGGGGGTNGNVGHNSGAGTQTAGGGAGYNSAQAGGHFFGGWGGQGSHGGGGGGGWYGGGGGGHSGGHYNGGGGGSGHSLELNSVAGYRNFWIKGAYGELVSNSYMETSPSAHGTYVNMAAGRSDADWQYAGVGAGAANYNTNDNNLKLLGMHQAWRSGTNGRVVIRVYE